MNSFQLSEGIIIAIASVAAYTLTFLYEVGFLSAFEIPINLIRINLDTVLIAISSIFGFMLIIFAIANFLVMLLPESKFIQTKIIRISIILLPFLWKIFVYKQLGKYLIHLIIAIAIMVFLEFIVPIFQFRKKESYSEKLVADEMVEYEPRSRSTLLGRIRVVLGPFGYVFFIALFITAGLVYEAGRVKALTKEYFLVLGESSNIVVLRTYNDLLICAPFNRKTKEIEQKLIFKKIVDNTDVIYVREKVGPLRLIESAKK